MLLSPLFPIPPLPTLPRAVTPPHNLPAYHTPLIGRETEVAHLCQRMLDPAQRLVTLVGLGGVGKTQVARAAAQRILDPSRTSFGFSIADDDIESKIENPKLVLSGANVSEIRNSPFPDGVWFVPLAGVTVGLPDAEEAVVSAILHALQVTPTGQSTPRQRLISYLQPKQLLLVLDNFDHLLYCGCDENRSFPSAITPEQNSGFHTEQSIEATALLTWLLERAPHLSLLVTAQSQLHLKTEGVIPLAGLPVPVHDGEPRAMEYGSVRLLRERAGRAWPTFAPAAETLRSVTAICRLGEGSPLAIELVAGWASHYTYAQIEQAIRENLALLENALPGQPQQQHSLQAVCEFVWQRLTPPEQVALAGASVFHGSFSRAAFLAVTKARLTDLVSLNDRALLQQEGVGRYAMHDRVREFAGEKLHTLFGGGEELCNRHAEYYANFLQACEQELKNANQRQAVAAIQLDIHNIHAVWQRAIRLHHLPTLEKAQECLWYYYYLQGRSLEGEALFAAAATALHTLDTLNTVADQPSVQHALALGQVLNWQGWFHMQMGHADEALEIIQQSLVHFTQASDRMHRTMTYAHLAAGQIHSFWDEPTLALPHVTQGLTHATECGDPWGMAYASLLLGPLTLPSQPYKHLACHYQGSLTIVRSIGDPLLLIDNLVLCADRAIRLGDYDQAGAYLHESHQLGQDFALPAGRLSTQLCLAELDRVRGHYAEAKASSIASFHHCTEIGDDRSLTTILRTLGLLAYAGQAYDEAKQTLQESLRLAQHSGCQGAVVLALTPLGHSYLQLGEGSQARSMAQKSVGLAQQLPQREDRVALALGGLAEVETVLEAHTAAEATYQLALTIAMQIEAPPLILELLVGLAALRFKTGRATPAQLVEWLALPCQHPASTQATKDRAGQLLATVMSIAPSTTQPPIAVNIPVQDWPTTIAAILDADD